MDLASLSGILSLVGSAGSAALLAALVALILLGAIRKWWVPGWLYVDSERRAKDAATQAANSAQTTHDLTNALIRRATEEMRLGHDDRRRSIPEYRAADGQGIVDREQG